MLALTMILEDAVIMVRRTDTNDNWVGVICDCRTGKEVTVGFTDMQLGAILALGVAGPDFEKEEVGLNASISDHLYRIAEPAIANLPKECRPIP